MNKEEEILEAVSVVGKSHAGEVRKGVTALTNNVMEHGMLPKDAMGITDGQTEALYTQAYKLYNNGKYREAQDMFAMLMLINVLEPKYLLGAAACAHMLKDFEHAAGLYMRCGMFSPDNPVPYYHASDCYLQLNDKQSAIIALHMVINKSGDKPAFTTIKDRAKIMLEKLEKEQQEVK